jgi:hypothetical protein
MEKPFDSAQGKRRGFVFVFIPLMFAIFSGLNIFGNPRFQNYRAVDIVHVLGTGMLLGAAIVLFVFYWRGYTRR